MKRKIGMILLLVGLSMPGQIVKPLHENHARLAGLSVFGVGSFAGIAATRWKLGSFGACKSKNGALGIGGAVIGSALVGGLLTKYLQQHTPHYRYEAAKILSKDITQKNACSDRGRIQSLILNVNEKLTSVINETGSSEDESYIALSQQARSDRETLIVFSYSVVAGEMEKLADVTLFPLLQHDYSDLSDVDFVSLCSGYETSFDDDSDQDRNVRSTLELSLDQLYRAHKKVLIARSWNEFTKKFLQKFDQDMQKQFSHILGNVKELHTFLDDLKGYLKNRIALLESYKKYDEVKTFVSSVNESHLVTLVCSQRGDDKGLSDEDYIEKASHYYPDNEQWYNNACRELRDYLVHIEGIKKDIDFLIEAEIDKSFGADIVQIRGIVDDYEALVKPKLCATTRYKIFKELETYFGDLKQRKIYPICEDAHFSMNDGEVWKWIKRHYFGASWVADAKTDLQKMVKDLEKCEKGCDEILSLKESQLLTAEVKVNRKKFSDIRQNISRKLLLLSLYPEYHNIKNKYEDIQGLNLGYLVLKHRDKNDSNETSVLVDKIHTSYARSLWPLHDAVEDFKKMIQNLTSLAGRTSRLRELVEQKDMIRDYGKKSVDLDRKVNHFLDETARVFTLLTTSPSFDEEVKQKKAFEEENKQGATTRSEVIEQTTVSEKEGNDASHEATTDFGKEGGEHAELTDQNDGMKVEHCDEDKEDEESEDRDGDGDDE